MSEPPHEPELNAVERALAGLAPSAGALDRDALMFAAGQASARPGWGWPCATAGSALAAAVLGAVLLLRPAPDPVVRTITVTVPARDAGTTPPRPPEQPAAPDEGRPLAPKASPLPRGTDYLTVRRAVERWGDAGLPTAPLPAEDAPARADPFDLPPDVRADPWLQRREALLNPGGPL
jgi:hypothetical protein